jgi:hypothetical protein
VFAARIILPAGAEIAYPKPTNIAAKNPSHPNCKAKLAAAQDASKHPRKSEFNEPRLGKIALFAAKNHTAPKPPSPPIKPTASGGKPVEAIITGARTITPWFIAARDIWGKKTAKKAKMIDRNVIILSTSTMLLDYFLMGTKDGKKNRTFYSRPT